jgi:hypothetical protein
LRPIQLLRALGMITVKKRLAPQERPQTKHRAWAMAI